MPTSLKKLGLGTDDFSEMEKLKWVVTEKVHGANFSFVYEDGTLKYAKRKDYLSWNDDFFGFQLAVSVLEDRIIRLFEALSAEVNGAKYIIYGELFGGKYPHEEVEPVKDVHAIQTGVYYAPGINFCAFDIAIERESTNAKYYLDYETAMSYFDEYDVFYAKPLLIAKFSEAMNFNTRINSSVPQQLGLPSLSDNLIEGVVVKPFNQKSDSTISARPIVKFKNPEFDEQKKFHQAQKWTFIPDVTSKSEDLGFILEELRNYITENRLQSAISKIGALDFGNPQRVSEIEAEFLKDALTDFEENNNDLLEELSKEQQDWITERIEAEIRKVMASVANR